LRWPSKFLDLSKWCVCLYVSSSKFQVSSSEDRSTWNLKRGTWNSAQPLAFCAVVAALGWKRTKRITRLVVLPEYQGLGIGPRLAEEVAQIEAAKGNRVTITASHPAILGWCSRSPRWRYLGLKKKGSTPQRFAGRSIRSSSGRAVAAYEFQVSGSKFQVANDQPETGAPKLET
jgi:GNAT superfamily N-acetyltransferase